MTKKKVKNIIEELETIIPFGNWCNNGKRESWCPFFEMRKPTLSENGTIQSYYCHLLEEYVTKKECEINE